MLGNVDFRMVDEVNVVKALCRFRSALTRSYAAIKKTNFRFEPLSG